MTESATNEEATKTQEAQLAKGRYCFYLNDLEKELQDIHISKTAGENELESSKQVLALIEWLPKSGFEALVSFSNEYLLEE